jgi:eukaryotic-like serine/threonine-protein kinase
MFPAYPYVGQIFGDYKLLKGVGHGGFADVYLGEDIQLGKKVAVKVMHSGLSDADAVREFKREARVIATLEHPNIVEVFQLGSKANVPYIAMRYCPQGSLRSRHPRRTIVPLDQIVSYVKQIAQALQYSHDQGIIHRDIKPDNMLVDRYGNVLLSDFGISILSESRRANKERMAGTAAYMAPEQAREETVRASDQYALGITVYEWLTGSVPFAGTSFTQVAVQHIFRDVPPLKDKNPAIPQEVETVVMKALSKDPTDRYRTVSDFADTLEASAMPLLGLRELWRRELWRRKTVPSSVVWSPDSKFLAFTTEDDSSISIAEAATGQLVRQLSGAYTNQNLKGWSTDGKYMAVANHDEHLGCVLNAISGENVAEYEIIGGSKQFIVNGLTIWIIDSNVLIQENNSGKQILKLFHYYHPNHDDFLLPETLSPNGRYKVNRDKHNKMHIHDTSTGRVVYSHPVSFDMRILWPFAWWSPNGKILAVRSYDRFTVFQVLY